MTGPMVLALMGLCIALQYGVLAKQSEKAEVEATDLRRERLKRRREEDILLGRNTENAGGSSGTGSGTGEVMVGKTSVEEAGNVAGEVGGAAVVGEKS